MSHQPERALTHSSSFWVTLLHPVVEMSHQPERALTPDTLTDLLEELVSCRNESSA